MKGLWKFFKSRWRRPKHKGVSGNFSTIVIITGIVIGGWVMTGGEYPNLYPTYQSTPTYADPLPNQPRQAPVGAMTFRELLFKPRPTIPPPACEKAALVFLVDASNSMTEEGSNGNTKLNNLKTALSEFTATLPDTTLFGLYTFSSPNGGEPRERVRIAPLSEAKADIPSVISAINPPNNATTYMRQGFQFVQGPLASAKAANPDYKFNLIFISDGVPEEQYPPGCQAEFTLTGQCVGSRNYDKRYDPTGTWGDPDIPQAIKDAGVNIYSIVISNFTDAQVFPELEDLMQRISSGPEFYRESVGGGNLNTIYQQIKSSACR